VKGADHEVRAVPSVLDRLIDLAPKNQRDVLPTRAESVRELRRAVRRDLDTLLNSHNTFFDLSPDFAEAGQSVLTYGLPDFSEVRNSPDRLRRAIEAAIRTFEPRLTAVVATTGERKLTEPLLRLHVDARLVMDPSPEPVSFDIVMPLHTCEYEVKEGE
jgi:type VI secretion system protein ImpF